MRKKVLAVLLALAVSVTGAVPAFADGNVGMEQEVVEAAEDAAEVASEEISAEEEGNTEKEASLEESGEEAVSEEAAATAESEENTAEETFAREEYSWTVTVDGNGGHTADGRTSYAVTFSDDDEPYLDEILDENGHFVREGYYLRGWTRNPMDEDDWDYAAEYQAWNTTTFYAVWVEIPVVTVDGNGGHTEDGRTSYTVTLPEDTDYLYLDEILDEEGNFEREGYYLLGWTEYPQNENDWEDAEDCEVRGTTTFYAVWAELPKVTVDGNGGHTADGRTSYTVSFDAFDEAYLDDILRREGEFVREGFRLLGWATDPDSENPKDADDFWTDKSETYYAIWWEPEAISLDVTKHITYDTGIGGDEQYFSFTPETDGWYVFQTDYPEERWATLYLYDSLECTNLLGKMESWNTQSVYRLTGGQKFGIVAEEVYGGSPIDLTITKATSFVTLNGNGGALPDGEVTVEAPLLEGWSMYTVTNNVGDFTREGYRLDGWATEPDGEGESWFVPEEGKTYYAIWTRLVTVTLHGNGALTADGSETYVRNNAPEGSYISWLDNDCYRFEIPEGKTFAGWSLTADGPVADGLIEDGLHLYALWKTSYYQVILDANGGYFAVPEETSFTSGGYYGGKLEILPSDIPTSTTAGKIFDKWYYDAACTRPLETALSEFSPKSWTMLFAGYKDAVTPVSKITLNKTSGSMFIGKSATLKATVKPAGATNKAVTWKSSNKKIATVSSKGVVKAIAKGTVIITATAKDGSGVKATCKVTVKQPVTAVMLSKEKFALLAGRTYKLKAVATPSTANLRTVTWKSSNKKIATVTAEGVVNGIAPGTAYVTATAKDGSGVKATCKVVVRQPVTKLTVNKKTFTLKVGQKTTLKVTALPATAYNKAVTWKSSNTKVAKVNAQGTVKGFAKGTAILTATAKDGSGTVVKCKVTVK